MHSPVINPVHHLCTSATVATTTAKEASPQLSTTETSLPAKPMKASYADKVITPPPPPPPQKKDNSYPNLVTLTTRMITKDVKQCLHHVADHRQEMLEKGDLPEQMSITSG